MRIAIFRVAAWAVGLMIGTAAFAQQGQSLLQRTVEMVSSPNVAVDLGMSQSQLVARDKLFAAFQVERDKVMGRIDGATGAQIDSLNNEIGKLKLDLDTKLLGMLTNGQRDRLTQIGVQEEGSEALLDDAIAAQVGLTASQRNKIKSIYDGIMKAQDDYQTALALALSKVPDPGTSNDATIKEYESKQRAVVNSMKPREKVYLAAKTAGNKQIFGVLTPPQQKKWFALHGRPLAGKS